MQTLMQTIVWDNKLTVGVVRIDDQHKRLIQVINDLQEAVSEGRGKEVHDALFEELSNYFLTHFGTEEEYMRKYEYPEFEEHMSQHNMFTAKVKELRIKAEEGSSFVSEEALQFLTDWLVNHIMKTDKKMGAFLIEKKAV